MLEQEVLPVGLTFDDVLLIPAESSVLPAETNVMTRLTDRISLNIPLVRPLVLQNKPAASGGRLLAAKEPE